MGWDESAFGWLFNKVKAYQAAKDSRPRLLESEEVLAGFERLASFVAGKTLKERGKKMMMMMMQSIESCEVETKERKQQLRMKMELWKSLQRQTQSS